MPKTKTQKAATVSELVKEFKGAKSVAFANYQGLTVSQADELRAKAREADVRYVVAKKTLIGRAAKEAGYDINAKELPGMLGAAFAANDDVAPAKVLGDLSKKSTMKLVGGIFEGAVVPAEKVIALSMLPGKKELLGMFVGTLNGIPAAFVRALNAIREKQEAGSSSVVAEALVGAEARPERAERAEGSPRPEQDAAVPVAAALDAVPAAEEAASVAEAPAETPAPSNDAPAAEAPVSESKPEGDAPAA
ncbi:MAG TPA: 50S ribosomal protein L10 [Candidatus Methylomirabilis sp.]|nr:50S ribosomal protein L10 [Candidatus Methylomirabilis sp.]